MIGVSPDVSTEEAQLIIRRLQLDAYYSIVNAFRASGYLTKTKLQILQDLSSYLQLSSERHQAEVRRAVNDEELTALADLVTKDDSSYEWICEGRHPVPAQPTDTSYRLPRFPKLRKEKPRPVAKSDPKPAPSASSSPKGPDYSCYKSTQTPKLEEFKVKVEPKTEPTKPILVNLLSLTPDVIETEELEKCLTSETLIIYISLTQKEPASVLLPQPPLVVPFRVDQLFGKLLLDRAKEAKDVTGYIQLPLDCTKMTKDKLKPKPKQQRRRPAMIVNSGDEPVQNASNNSSPGGAAPQPRRRPRKKSVPVPTTEQLTEELATEKKAQGEQKIAAPPPLLAKPPQFDMSPSYHSQPPALQRMPSGLTPPQPTISPVKPPLSQVRGTPSGLKPSPRYRGDDPLKMISPVKSGQELYTQELPHTPEHRQNMDSAINSQTEERLWQEHQQRQHHQHQQHQLKGRSDAHIPTSLSGEWHHELTEPRQFVSQKELEHYQQEKAASRKYITSQQEKQNVQRQQQQQGWQIPEQMRQDILQAAKHSPTTPEKVQQAIKQETQRFKAAEEKMRLERNKLVEDRQRTEERAKQEERLRIEERLKHDEMLRSEEKRVEELQRHTEQRGTHLIRVDEKKEGGDKERAPSKHDPTTSYLSTFLPKGNGNKGIGARRVSSVGKGKGKQIPVTEATSGVLKLEQTSMPVRIGTPTGGVRVEQVSNARITTPAGGVRVEQVSNSRIGTPTGVRVEQVTNARIATPSTGGVRVEQVSNARIGTPTGSVRVEQVSNAGQKVSIVTSELGHGVTQYIVEKKQEEAPVKPNPKPTIQILTQPNKDSAEKKKEQSKSSYAGYQQSIFYPSSKVTTAPTICVKTTKPVVSSTSQPKPYMPYSSKVPPEMASLYSQQMIQQQFANVAMMHNVGNVRNLYTTKPGKEGEMQQRLHKMNSKAIHPHLVDVGGLLHQQQKEYQQRAVEEQQRERQVTEQRLSDQRLTEKILSEQRLTEQQRLSEQQRQISDQQRQVILQQTSTGYRIAPSGQIVGKYPGAGFDLSQQYLALAANQAQKTQRADSRKVSKQSQYNVSSGKPYVQYMGNIAKPQQQATETTRHRGKGTTPEDVFRFPDDDEERPSNRRGDDSRQKQGSGDRHRQDSHKAASAHGQAELHFNPQEERHILLQQKHIQKQMILEKQLLQEKHTQQEKALQQEKTSHQEKQLKQLEQEKALAEKQMQERMREHEKHVQEEGKRLEEELLWKMKRSQAEDLIRAQHEHQLGDEKEHYSTAETRYHPTVSTQLTTPHLTVPVSSAHLSVSSQQQHHSQQQSDNEREGELLRQRKRKLVEQDRSNPLMKAALSLVQCTLKQRTKPRFLNTGYPSNLWHQQSLEAKFIERGLSPVDLSSVKKKLEFGEYPNFELFYQDIQRFQSNNRTYYPAEHPVRQEFEENMDEFVKELTVIFHKHSTVLAAQQHSSQQQQHSSQKKHKTDS